MAVMADKIARLRAEKGWTLKHLSHLTGISVSHLSAIEHGTRPNPSFQYVVRLSEAFGVPIDYFCDNGRDFREPATDPPAPPDQKVSADDEVIALAHRLQQLYDDDTRRFIASEQSRPYVCPLPSSSRNPRPLKTLPHCCSSSLSSSATAAKAIAACEFTSRPVWRCRQAGRMASRPAAGARHRHRSGSSAGGSPVNAATSGCSRRRDSAATDHAPVPSRRTRT